MKHEMKCPACSAELEIDTAPSFREMTGYGFKVVTIAFLAFGLFFWVAFGLLALGNRIGPMAFKAWQGFGGG